MKKILFLNAPPRAGKDTFANYVAEKYGVQHIKFAQILKERTHRAYGLDHAWDFYEDVKDVPNDDFLGITPRQAYINFSELLMKPVHGKGVWAKPLLERVLNSSDTQFVVSDLGFQVEWETFIEQEGICSGLVRIYRGTCDYSNDSREFVAARGPWKHIQPTPEWNAKFNRHIIGNCWELENNGNDFAPLYNHVDQIAQKFFA